MLHKILLVSKKEEAGIIVISRILGVLSLALGLVLLLMFWLTQSHMYLMMGSFFMTIFYPVFLIFIFGLMAKFVVTRRHFLKSLLSAIYISVNFILMTVYDQILFADFSF